MSNRTRFVSALEDFNEARRQASVEMVLSWLTGKSDELLSYEDVRLKLNAIESANRSLKDIPIEAIIGSVNRYTDFTKNFFPRRTVDKQRWARVKAESISLRGLPPIEVYQIGDVYFVQDGNHRVSVARQEGDKFIQAYVKEVNTRVPLTPQISPDELIIQSEYLTFLEHTQINHINPQTRIMVTSPGSYSFLLQQIEAVHFALELKLKRDLPFKEAVTYWHDKIYLPIIEVLTTQGLLLDHPERTETDLFIWMIRHQSELENELGWKVSPESAALSLSSDLITRSEKVKSVFSNAFRNWLYGPEVGEWRKSQLNSLKGRLFSDILVILIGGNLDQFVLDLGLYIAKMEGSQILGLYLAPPKTKFIDKRIELFQVKFDQLCEDANVKGNLAIAFERDSINHIIRRSRFVNLVIIPLEGSYFSQRKYQLLIKHCPTPLITIARRVNTPLNNILVAYDGSPKADEALFIGAYLNKFWELSLSVLSVETLIKSHKNTIANAKSYLEKFGIEAKFYQTSGSPSTAVVSFLKENEIDLTLTGGYSANAIKKIVTGSMVDEIIKKSNYNIFICK